jgi:hypothetical protein
MVTESGSRYLLMWLARGTLMLATHFHPNHFSSNLNLIQSPWRQRLHVPPTCWNKFFTLYNAITPKTNFEQHSQCPKNLYPFASFTYVMSGEIKNVLVLTDCLLQCHLISRNKTLWQLCWKFLPS